MRIIYLTLILIAFTGCTNKFENDPALGGWRLAQVLNDTGDGNATYVEANSEKTLLFTAYGTVIGNQAVCIGNNHSEATVAQWEPEFKRFTEGECYALYEVSQDGDTLTVTYNCMETCAERYTRGG